MKLRVVLTAGLLALLAVTVAGCGPTTSQYSTPSPNAEPSSSDGDVTSMSTEPPVPHFPQVREGAVTEVMEALLEGELMLENGCLRAKKMNGTDYLLIWPPGFKLRVDGGEVRISDNTGISLAVGEEVRIGGGEVPLPFVQILVEQPLPRDCTGPYWIVGETWLHGS